MFQGKLIAIAIARQAKGAMERVELIEAVAGEGLRGDRYGAGVGAAQLKGRRKPENEVTLIAREAIEAANDEFNYTIEHLETRRNLLTEGVPLNQFNPSSGSSCAGDIRLIQEATLGFWHKPYVGPKGRIQWGIQYSYISKVGWSGTGGGAAAAPISPKAIDNMIFTSLRYYIP